MGKRGLYSLQSTSVNSSLWYGTDTFPLNQAVMGKNTAATKSRKFKRNGKRREKAQTFEEMASVLKLKIDIDDEDLETQFKEFQNCYPEGKINEEEFLEIFSNNIVFSPNSLFRVFDVDGSGSLDFQEFTLAMNCTHLTNPEDKLNWIFNVFDEDGGGSIDLEEVHKLVLSLLQLTEAGDTGEESVQACIQAIIQTMDGDGDGTISKEEFIDNALKIEFINNILNGGDEQNNNEQN